MKKSLLFCFIAGLFLVVSSAAVYSQSTPAVVSPEFSSATSGIADFILNAVEKQRNRGEVLYLQFDAYSLNEQRTSFGMLLASSVSARLVEKGSDIAGVIAADYLQLLRRNDSDYQLPDTDLIVTGKVFKLADNLLIQTSLIDPDRGVITATHETKIGITPELFALLSSSPSQAIDDLYEPDGPDNPTAVEGEFSEHSHTLTSGDEDWYLYRSGRSGLVSFGTEGDLDTVISVYGPDDRYTTIAYNDDAENSENARVVMMTEAGKSYYFQIQGYEGEQSGAYTAYLSYEEFNDPLEPNNVMSDALIFPIEEGNLEAQFYPQSDIDWYRFTVPGRSDRGLNIGPSGGAIPIIIETHSGIDPDLTLYDSNGNELGYSDDDGSDYNARLSVSVTPGGTYYLKLTEIDSGTGGYMLSISGLE